jgi:hypothetical protein
VLFSVWFYFAPFVLADGGSRGMGALLESREYVRGHWFAVFFRILFIWGLYALLLLVPLAGPLLALVFLPLILFYNAVLYDNLKSLQGGVRFTPRSGAKAGILATSTAGYLLPPLLLLALMGPMAWQALERHATFGDPQPPVRTFKIAPVPAAGEATHRFLRVAPASGLYYYGRRRLRLLQSDPGDVRADFPRAQPLEHSKAVARF